MLLSMLRRNRGSALILFALMLTAILGFGALVIDVGRLVLEKNKLQHALDASVLAAAQDLPDTSKATETAHHYMALNGYGPSDYSVSFSDSDKVIRIVASKSMDYTLAKVLGFSSATLSPSAAAQAGALGEAFDYVLFSGSKTTTLTLNGSNQYVGGNSHTNKNFVANGSKLTITGACEAMTTITVNGSQIDIKKKVPNAPYVSMPDFSETIRLQAEKAGKVYNGNKTYNGSSIVVDEPIYVNGSITVNGSRFRGTGCVLATGDITFNGSNLNETTDDAVCFYSKNGNIIINGSNATFDGIVYAPSGSIIMNGSNQTVNGRVIGNTVTFNGSHLQIIGSGHELSSLPKSAVRLIQ